jgi:16S rRNA processing protein RimM
LRARRPRPRPRQRQPPGRRPIGADGDFVVVGRVGRPHGLDGSFVVERPSDRLARGVSVWVGDEPAEIVAARRVGGGRLAIRLDRPAARGALLLVPRGELPEPEADTYYVFQLVGLEVAERGGPVLGRVVEVQPYPANDVLELDDGTLLPLVEDCVLDVDLDAGRIVVAPGYAEHE